MSVKQQADAGAGRVVAITGAGTGLGRAYALQFAQSGWRVLVSNRCRERDAQGRSSAERVVEEIRAAGGAAVASHEDVTADDAGPSILSRALETWGRLDALVNNAGIDQHVTFHKASIATLRSIFEVNFFGTVGVTHAVWAHMRSAGHGRVVVSSSGAGLHGLHGLSAYAASKAALIALARSLAAEGASHDVYCNVIAPYAATRMTEPHVPPQLRDALAPERVAPLVVALCDPRSTVNGQVFVAAAGSARRAASVEATESIELSDPAAALARLAAMRVDAASGWSEFDDAQAAFADLLGQAAREPG